jgi:hypothetical protein
VGATPVAGATNTTLALTNVSLSQNGTLYSVVVTNIVGSITSAPAMLTVVASPPTITAGTTLPGALSTTYGTASSAQSESVSGANLTANITATAQAGFQVSSDGSTFGSTATYTESGGSASGTVYVRLSATAAGGSYNSVNAVVLSSTSATSQDITTASSGNVVNPAPEASFAITTTSNTAASFNVFKLTNSAQDSLNAYPLTVTAVTSPSANGTVVLSGNTITYTPTTGYTGSDSFTYTLSDNLGGSSTGTVTVTVNDINASSSLTDIVVTNGVSATITASGLPTTSYHIQVATSPSGPWSTIDSATSAANGVLIYTDEIFYPTNYPNPGFYRLAQ